MLKPKMLEKEFQAQVLELAARNHWKAVHFKTVMAKSARGGFYGVTPYDGDGKGFPDTVLARAAFHAKGLFGKPRPGRLVFMELKRQGETPSPEQEVWLEVLRGTGLCEVYWFQPSDWDEIVRILT